MTENPLSIGCFRYDTTRALFEEPPVIDGSPASVRTARTLPEIFGRLIHDQEFDIAELGLTFYLRLLASGLPYVALPIFPVRLFRHSAIFVNTDSGITGPADLVGRTIGEFGVYGQDPGVWMKGILHEDYGFAPERNRWVIGGLDRCSPPFDFAPHPHPPEVEVRTADAPLSAMLESGEIDALFTANVPQRALDGSTRIARLFLDHEAVERDYYRRTGIFPIMHTVVVRRELLDRRPGLAREVFRIFSAAKHSAVEGYREQRRIYQAPTMLPWANALFERNELEFGADWWPYGIAANRSTLDTFLRYHHEQGLSPRYSIEEVFGGHLLDT
ncbi:4,5-dihydroxyphthalate decarboxylase [Nocardia takedensis]